MLSHVASSLCSAQVTMDLLQRCDSDKNWIGRGKMRILVKSIASLIILNLVTVVTTQAAEPPAEIGPFSDSSYKQHRSGLTDFGARFEPYKSNAASSDTMSVLRPRYRTIELPLHVYVSASLFDSASFVESGRFDLAINALGKLKKTLRSAEVHYIRALCAQAKSEFDLAKNEFQFAQNTTDKLLISKAQIGYNCASNKQSKISFDQLSFPSDMESYLAPDDQAFP
jgi:hypothetical protein